MKPGQAQTKASPPPAFWHRENVLSPGRFAGLLGLLTLVSFPNILLRGQKFFAGDFVWFGYPLAFYHKQAFWRAEFPLWNPLNNCGEPLLAQGNTLALYPLSIIYLLLPLPWSLGLFCLAHMFMGGLGMYFLARRWSGSTVAAGIAGAGFAFNPIVLHCLQWPSTIAALAWTPWVIITVEKAWHRGGKYTPLAALTAAMPLMTGAWEMITPAWLVIGLVFCVQLYRSNTRFRMTRRLVTIAFLALCLSAAQTLPFLDLLAHSQSSNQFDPENFSLPEWGWANLVVPLFRGPNPAATVPQLHEGQFWIGSGYMGLGLLGLALAGVAGRRRYALPLAFAAVLGFWFALGPSGGLYDFLARCHPFLRHIRVPLNFVVLPMYALPLLAALGVAAALSQERIPGSWGPRRWFAILFCLAALSGGLIWFASSHPSPDLPSQAVLWSGITRLGLFGALALVLVLHRRRLPSNAGLTLPVLAIALVWTDGVTQDPHHPPSPPAALFQPGLLASRVHPAPVWGTSRILLNHETKPPAFPTTERFSPKSDQDYFDRQLALPGNYNLVESFSVVDAPARVHRTEPSILVDAMAQKPDPSLSFGLRRFLGVSQISLPGPPPRWEGQPAWEPLITIGRTPVFLKKDQTPSALLRPDYDPAKIVFAPDDLKAVVPSAPPVQSHVLSQKLLVEHISAEFETDKPALITVAQTLYWPWTPYVDGKKVDLLRVNYAFQGVLAPAGHHRIDLVYEDNVFRGGVLVSVAAFAVCVWILWRFGPRRGGRDAAA